ncbi:MAG: peptidase inhibitor family I36 protein [Acidimicrobiia bacterium]|nr:peptidase inhibitor family I36 protein [Acidimicrobiia bacterium]
MRGTRKRLGLLVLTLALIVGSGSLALAHSFSSCQTGEFCVFGVSGYSGDWHDPDTDDPNWPCCGHHGVQNDDDSFQNKETTVVRVFDGTNYTGGTKYCATDSSNDWNINDNVDNDGNSNDTLGTSTCPAGDIELP